MTGQAAGMVAVVDALGRRVALASPARRVVSLVPSETDTVARLAGVHRLAGRTRFCLEPPEVEAVPVVGGTKDVDVEAVAALAPDLVLANKEENTRHVVEAMIAAGLPVHVSFPRTVPEGIEYLEAVATLLGVVEPPELVQARAAFAAHAHREHAPVRVFVPIWKDPWMTFDEHAFASDLLALVGGVNVFADRPRRYPLAADLGKRAALTGARVAERDTRYPRIRLEEVVEREPELVLLPDEPYEFTGADRIALEAHLGPAVRVVHADGKDLFWYGARLATSIESLAAVVRAGSEGS